MAFQISPGVNVSEIDLTTIVPAVSTTEGAIAGVFPWGPVELPVLVSSQDDLVNTYGKPTTSNFETFFTAANFLDYGNKLYVSRAASNSFNAVAQAVQNAAITSTLTVKNVDDYNGQGTGVSQSSNNHYVAKFPGALGNSLRISVCDSANAFSSTILGNGNNTVTFAFTVNSNSALVTVVSTVSNTDANTMLTNVFGNVSVGDIIVAGNSTIGTVPLKVTSKSVPAVSASNTAAALMTFSSVYTLSSNVSMAANATVGTVQRYWEFYNLVESAPGTSLYTQARGGGADEVHVVVVDNNGGFSGIRGQVLEVWKNLSRATDAVSENGGSQYYRTVINNGSAYVWWATDRSGAASNTAVNVIASTNLTPFNLTFYGGTDGFTETTIPIMDLARAYDKYKSSEDIDISLILTGKARGGSGGEQLANYLIDNIAEYRKDCIVFCSPDSAGVVNNFLNPETTIVNFRNLLRSSSYAVLDSGFKYQYDKYNDVYRWVPLNGDVAGLCVRTDEQRDAWWSPAGFNRGQIKKVVKLAFNPDKARRDILYKAGVNPVVTFPGEGTVLYGDKTLLAKPSAFDRINVRRLFIVLEKSIAVAAKYTLFEFNDEFTRAQFRNLVEPYLRDVQGRRGIYDFRVVCDTTNNTAEVIDSNRFVGDIYVKPARSINFIQLNFVAVRTGVDFEEIVGKF